MALDLQASLSSALQTPERAGKSRANSSSSPASKASDPAKARRDDASSFGALVNTGTAAKQQAAVATSTARIRKLMPGQIAGHQDSVVARAASAAESPVASGLAIVRPAGEDATSADGARRHARNRDGASAQNKDDRALNPAAQAVAAVAADPATPPTPAPETAARTSSGADVPSDSTAATEASADPASAQAPASADPAAPFVLAPPASAADPAAPTSAPEAAASGDSLSIGAGTGSPATPGTADQDPLVPLIAPGDNSAVVTAGVAPARESMSQPVPGESVSVAKAEATPGSSEVASIAKAEATPEPSVAGDNNPDGIKAGEPGKAGSPKSASEVAPEFEHKDFRDTSALRTGTFAQGLEGLSASSAARSNALLGALEPSVAAQAQNARLPEVARPTPLQLLPLEIGMQAVRGAREFQIRLDPAELGRVDVKLHINDKGEVNAALIVERPETLQLLRRDASTLTQAFEQAGLKQGENALNFSLRGENQQGQQQQDGRADRTGGLSDDPALNAAVAEIVTRRVMIPHSSLDLMV